MDAVKTGAMIAEARKEKGLTQRQLAETLHVSDRTVSKWERGAGFPDVALLEPLADALGLSVTSLLRGEKANGGGEEDVRYAVRTIRKVTLAKIRKNAVSIVAYVLLLTILFLCVSQMLAYNGVFAREICHELTAGVYIDGEWVADTSVTIDGRRWKFGKGGFNGHFAIDYVEKTCRDEVSASVNWQDGYVSMMYYGYGDSGFVDIEYFVYINDTMESFAIQFGDGTIVATSEYLAELMDLDSYYPLVWNAK